MPNKSHTIQLFIFSEAFRLTLDVQPAAIVFYFIFSIMKPLKHADWEGKEVVKYWEEVEQSKKMGGGLESSVG